MQIYSILDFKRIFQVIFFIFLGIIVSIFILGMTPLLIFAAPVGILLLIASISKPEIGILALVIIISSIIFEEALPLMPIGIGSFHVPDVILLFLLFMIPFKLTTDKNFRLVKTPLDKPLLFFYLAALISAFIAITYFNVDFNIVMRKLRYVTYYLIFFVVTNLIREKRNIKFLIKGLFVIATIVGICMIIQAIVGESIQLLPGRVEAAKTLGQVYGATRILPPGHTLIYVTFITVVCVIAFINKPILKSSYFYMLIIVGIGILLTYSRNYWIAIVFSLSIFMLLISKRGKKKVISWFAIVVILMGILAYAFLGAGGRTREFVVSISDRFTSLFTGEQMFRSATLEWRKIENEYAIKQIVKHPIFGIGLANNYRPGGAWPEGSYYIHNGYLWIMLKMGLIGFLPFFWFYIRFLISGFLNWKRIKDNFSKSAVTGFMLSGAGILLAVIVNPMFMQWYSIVVIATMIGLTEAIIKINEMEVKKLNG